MSTSSRIPRRMRPHELPGIFQGYPMFAGIFSNSTVPYRIFKSQLQYSWDIFRVWWNIPLQKIPHEYSYDKKYLGNMLMAANILGIFLEYFRLYVNLGYSKNILRFYCAASI